MINLPPADWKHIQAQIAAASKPNLQKEQKLMLNPKVKDAGLR